MLREDEEKRHLVQVVVKSLLIEPTYLENWSNIDNRDDAWLRIVTLCHLTIYLIDMFQKIDNNPKWEEYRVFLVRVLKEFNKKNSTTTYLYTDKDLISNSLS